MTQDVFEQLRAANPLPEDPAPLPMASLVELADEVPRRGVDGRPSLTTSVDATTGHGHWASARERNRESDSH
jgi:hypothetical protein